jgi:hypothetical protein
MGSPTENVTTVSVPYPESPELHLRIAVGACRLSIKPADAELFVSGTYQDQSHALPLRVEQAGGNVTISQNFTWPETFNVNQPARLDLAIGKARPFDLVFEVGANEGVADLGGLPITRLSLKHGAGKQSIDFSAPNPQAMEQLTVTAGAVDLELRNLANANFRDMFAEGGAAAFHFDYGGRLARDGSAVVTTGMAALELRVPASTPAVITTDATLGSVEVGDGFMKKEGAFHNEAALAGRTPTLSIRARVAMGSIMLKVTP